MNKPIVGLLCPWSVETWGSSMEEGGYYYVGHPYVRAIYQSGGIPLLIPCYYEDDVEEHLEGILSMVHGLLFTGGGDVKRASDADLPSLQDQQPIRYHFERKLLIAAFKKRIPMMGICRGFQMMVEAFGGSLAEQTIAGHKQKSSGKEASHQLLITEGSQLREVVKAKGWDVNSFHIQQVEKVPEGFVVSATSLDGVIEAIEGLDYPFLVGVQFHPEELAPEDFRAFDLFNSFIEATKRFKDQ